MAGPTQPRSPRLSWAFGSNGPCEEVLDLLAKEHIDSGVLLADAFSSLAGGEAFAAMRGCSVEATSQLALAWTRANSVADLWAETGVAGSCSACSWVAFRWQLWRVYCKDFGGQRHGCCVGEGCGCNVEDWCIHWFAPWTSLRAARPIWNRQDVAACVFGSKWGCEHCAAVRAVERLERWSLAHGILEVQWSGLQLARFLSDAAHGGYSVPVSVRSGLKLMADALLLKWPLDHCRLSGLQIGKKKICGRQSCSLLVWLWSNFSIWSIMVVPATGLLACGAGLFVGPCLPTIFRCSALWKYPAWEVKSFWFLLALQTAKDWFSLCGIACRYSANPWADTLCKVWLEIWFQVSHAKNISCGQAIRPWICRLWCLFSAFSIFFVFVRCREYANRVHRARWSQAFAAVSAFGPASVVAFESSSFASSSSSSDSSSDGTELDEVLFWASGFL